MKKSTTLLILVACLFAGTIAAQETLPLKINALTDKNKIKEDTERLHALYALYMDYVVQTYPEFGTFIGRTTYQTNWTDYSAEAIARRKKERALFLSALATVDDSKLPREEQLNYDLLRNTLLKDTEGDQFPSELMPINQMDGFHQTIAQIGMMTPITTEQQARDFITRLDKVPVAFDQLMTLMNEGIKRKIMPSKVSLTYVPEQLHELIAAKPEESIFLQSFRDYIATLPSEKREALWNTAKKSIEGRVNPALARLQKYMEKTYLPAARESVGLKDLPNGANWYNYQVQLHTTTKLTYQEIHAIGMREVKRIRKSMDSLIVATGFKGSFQEFSEFLRTDKRFYFDSAAQLLDAYRVICKKIDPELPRFFGKLPRMPYGVTAVPSFDEKSRTTAYYMMGSPETGRAGYFYANTYDLKSRPKWEMEALTIHEAVPGHHLQISLAQEMDSVPEFRRYESYTAFIEGWGLYAESLGSEMGFYKDPYSKFGQLTYEMWRAIRLVVDTGMHGMGWTRQQAIDFFKENTAKSEHDITVEIDRYITWPGQALAYKIGELKIKELRAKATRELGAKFNIRAFHDAVLENGALPLNVLEQKINDWILAEKK